MCGNGICDLNDGENCVTCSEECSNLPCGMKFEQRQWKYKLANFKITEQCGNGVCDTAETCSNCVEDCGLCSKLILSATIYAF